LHDARHTAATLLYEASQDLRLVQKQLGHSRPSITAVYADVCDEKAREGVAAMEQLAKRAMKTNRVPAIPEPVLVAETAEPSPVV
jgi:integrase